MLYLYFLVIYIIYKLYWLNNQSLICNYYQYPIDIPQLIPLRRAHTIAWYIDVFYSSTSKSNEKKKL